MAGEEEEELQQCIIQQRLNPLTGTSEWVVIRHDTLEENGTGNESGRSLAQTQYLDMLNDGPRNRAYDQAIRKVVKAGDHVLDIGAGTGLLSMMAWRAMYAAAVPDEVDCSSIERANDGTVLDTAPGTFTGKITACESYLPMGRLARKLLRANGMVPGVRLIHKRSDEMKMGIDLPSPADVLISEILDSELLGEGLIPTLRHAHAQLLKPSVRSVPHRATIYGQLVNCDYLWRCHDLAGVEADLGDGLLLATSGANEVACGSSATMHIDALANQLNLISEPFEVFEFNFNRMPAQHGVSDINVPIARAGTVHALVSWWRLQLDEDGEINYSTAPQWIQTEAGRGMTVCPEETVTVRAIHNEINVKYVIGSPSKVDYPWLGGRKDGTFVGQGAGHLYNLAVRPERIGFLGDPRFRQIIKEAVTKAVKAKSSPLCLIVDDSVICTITAALSHSDAHVVAMLPGLHQEGSLHIKSIIKANGVNFDKIHVVGKKAAELTAGHLNGGKVEVFIAEPYYKDYENFLPWRHLRFWSERTLLAPLLVDNPTILPCQGILRGVAVSLPDLWHSRKGLSHVEGFDHSHVNQLLGACGELSSNFEGPLLPYSLWQCGEYKELTCPFSIMNFDFFLPIQTVKGSVKVPVSSSGLCHGIALWMDWVMDSETNLVLSTGPSGGEPNYWKQGVKLLSSPVQLFHNPVSEETGSVGNPFGKQNHSSELLISALFHPSNGDIEVELSITSQTCP